MRGTFVFASTACCIFAFDVVIEVGIAVLWGSIEILVCTMDGPGKKK